jgi:hypothetical protein
MVLLNLFKSMLVSDLENIVQTKLDKIKANLKAEGIDAEVVVQATGISDPMVFLKAVIKAIADAF